MADNDRRTLIEDGTEIEGTIKSKCPVSLNGKVDGKVSAPSLEVTKSGSVNGRVQVEQLRSQGEISGEIVWGVGIHANIVMASLRAVVSAANRAAAQIGL